ncbi:MAG: reverse transcriptase-like protein [Deltaproteobacteria bacterium]|nr:MAG: reverse transcriptase-like protein [Deltaproteobacteria bacterium]
MSRVPVTVRVDGASRGNPGPAGAGAVVEFGDGRPPVELCSFLGETTNNVAEYRALLLALEEAGKHSPGSVTVFSDSELLVRQMNGQYKVKAEHLRPLYLEACRRLRAFPAARILHVGREQNRRADRLANLAIDQQR